MNLTPLFLAFGVLVTSLSRLWAAPAVNFEVDFSAYASGSVIGQTEGILGPEGWSGSVGDKGEIVPSPDRPEAARALEFWRSDGTGRISAPLASPFFLNEVGYASFAFDIYKPGGSGGGTVCLASTTPSFGIVLSPHPGAALQVHQSFGPGKEMRLLDTGFVITENTWYRIEFEITLTGPGNTGYFDLYISSPSTPRRVIASKVAYAFQNAAQKRLNLISAGIGSERRLLIANISVQSGIDPFPSSPNANVATPAKAPVRGVLDVGQKRQLFIDRKFLEDCHGLTLEGHAARKTGLIVLQPDKPWEKGGYTFAFQVLRPQDGKWQMWYEARSLIAKRWQDTDNKVHYAESEDGIRWRKPSLGLLAVDGDKDNNAVYAGPSNQVAHGMGVFIDPTAPAEERYKMVIGDFAQKGAPLHGAHSADGIHWLTYPGGPVINQGADTQTSAFYDPNRKSYVIYVRRNVRSNAEKYNPDGIRRVGRSESTDFQKFPASVDVLKADEGDPPFTGLYNNAVSIYPEAEDVYVAFPSLFPDEKHSGGSLMEPFLAVSRDGVSWTRPSRRPFLALGAEGPPGAPIFTSREIFVSPGIFPVGDELFIFYTAMAIHHGQAGPQIAMPMAYFLATLRRDGFVSVRADQQEGHFTTPPLIFQGNSLEMNLALQADGTIRVGLLEEDGTKIPGFGADEMDALWGDNPRGLISWRGRSDLSALAGRPIRLQVFLRQGDLYAFQFKDQTAAEIASRLAAQTETRAKGSAITVPDPGAQTVEQ